MSLTANFLAELPSTSFNGNVVIQLNGDYFAQYQPDSGLVIDADKLGIVDNAKINGVSVDVRKANTPISTANFDLLDKNAAMSSYIGASDNSLQGAEVNIYFGYRTGSFDFADYALLSVTTVTSITKEDNGYKFSSKEVTDLLQVDLLNTKDNLDASLSDVATTLDLVDASNFPATGRVKIDNEFIQYTGITTNTLTGLTRAGLSSTAAAHDDGDDVFLVTEKIDPSMDILLDILLIDLALDPSLVDSTSFTDLRDNEFSGEADFTLYTYDIDNALKWIETRLLEATNTRIFSVNGVITIGLLDQVPKFDSLPEITEEHTTRVPSWKLSSDKLVNTIIVKWSFSEGLNKFTRTSTFTDADSVTIFGPKKALTLKLYGVSDSSIVSNRANRLLARFSTPKAQVKVRTHLNRLALNIAENVRLSHRFLPQSGGTLGFVDTLEVMSKSVSGLHSRASLTFGLEFSSYSGIRIGLISPSPRLNLTITDQRTFTVPNGTYYAVGYFLVLWDNVNNVYFADAANQVVDVTGNVITMASDFTTTLGSNVSLYFSSYDLASGDQKAKYAYIAPDTNVFLSDNSKAYQVIF